MITSYDLKYLRVAEMVSKFSDYKRIHIGACIVKKHVIISTGYNKDKTHPIQGKYNIDSFSFIKSKDNIHAEIDALHKSNNNVKGATLYVFRRGKDGIYRMSKPCQACMKYIKDSGIKRIVYTIENGIKELII